MWSCTSIRFALPTALSTGLQLLRDIEAAAPLLEHRDNAPEMTFGPSEPFDDFWM